MITGASRGISRATARLFAERGASVVLAARSEGALLEAAAECEAMSARALAVLTDVADWEAVEELARRSVERFGRIDVWVNNAVLAAVGRLEDVPPVANLLGYMHGARAALPRFREQDSGVLINMSSGFGLVGAPYADAYTATKFAQRGLAQALRGELRGNGVHVCTIMPGGVDTPAYRLAANYSGRVAGPKGFLASSEKIARVVVWCAERPRPEVVVGNSVRTLRLTHTLAPRARRRAVAWAIERGFSCAKSVRNLLPETCSRLHRSGPVRTGVQRGGEAKGKPRGATHRWHRGVRRRRGVPGLAWASRSEHRRAEMSGYRRSYRRGRKKS